MNFEVSKPTAYPYKAPPGPVLISIPIKAFVAGYVTVRMAIYEGSIWGGYGDWIESQDQTVFFSAGQTKTVQFTHHSQYRTQERRDVRIVIFDEWGTLFDSGDKSDWDDVFYVVEGEEPETLEVDITGGYGHVTTNPASIEGKSTWYDGDTGTFPYGTEVLVTAHPNSGYKFEKWSDEIEGGVSYDNPAYVKPMTEHRAVKCHFRVIEEEPVWPLEIDITPSAGGVVRTNPASIEGREEWRDGNIGTFEEGTIVRVTAVPNNGYQFEKWTDEIQGGTSYSNPASVKPMTEHRAVKCHYRLIEEPPECSIDSDCPPGYSCANGKCIKIFEPPPTCTVDSDCPEGYVCKDGKCIKKEKMNWLPVALIGGGVMVGLIALSKPGKKKDAG